MKIIKFVFLSLILFFTSCKRVADFSSDLIRYSLAFDTANLIPQSEILTSGIVSTIAEGESIEIGIKLKEDPKKTLTVNIQTNSPSLLINNLVETSLEFTRENYATEQKVILNAPVDVNSVSESATITFSADGLGEVSKTFTVTDDLTIVVTGNPSSIQEGNSAPVGIKLSKKPTETKTILIQSDKPSLVIDGNSTKSLTFTPDNYSVPQTIQFQTVIDGDSISDSVNITLSMEGIPDINYSLTVLDDITIQVSGVPSTLTELTSANVAVRFSRNLITDNSITITSDNPSLQVNGGSSATLNFTPLNSTADQSFSITAIDDANLSNEVVNLTFSAPGVNDAVVTLTVIDNDTMNFVVSGVPATINEGTISNTMQVSLTQQPGTDYVVNLTTNNLPSLTVSPTTLTFNSGNYNTPQMITLTAPEESNETSEEVTIILTATNAPLQTQKVTVIDNDTRILIGGADSVLEGGEGIITVSLSGSPGIDRTISLNSSNTLAGTITPSSLTFTSSNYSSSITLTGIQDNNAINETTIISGTSTGLLSGNKTISIIDDDTINFDIAGGNQILEGGTLDLQVRLTFSPTSNLTVNINSQNTDAITLNTGTLTFTPTNYNDYQTITLKGEEDANESSESVNINFTATGVPNHTHVVSTIDNDTRPELGGNFTVPEESFSVATVVLSANPGGTKTVYLSSLNTNAVTVSPSSLTFNESNWNSPQSIILSGVADNNVIPEAVTIRAVSGSVQVDQTVNTTDNDTLAMIITDEFGNSIPLGTTIQIDEGTGKKFKVKFNYEPSSTVTVNFSNPLTPSSVQLLNFSPSSLSFNSTNYSTEQTVTITALENDYIDDKTTTAGFHPTGGFSTGRTFNILVKDNDPIVHVRVPGNSAGAGFNPHIFYDPITEFGPFQIFTENSQGDVTSEQILINTACDSNFSCTFGIPSNISSGSNTTNNLKILINTYSEGNPIFSPRFFAVTRNAADNNKIYIFYNNYERIVVSNWGSFNVSDSLPGSNFILDDTTGFSLRTAIDNINGRIYILATTDMILANCKIGAPPTDCKYYKMSEFVTPGGSNQSIFSNLALDTRYGTNVKLYITFGDRYDSERLKGILCNVEGASGVLDSGSCIVRNLTNMESPVDGSGSYPIIDTINNKIIINHTNHSVLLTTCNLDLSGCNFHPTNWAQGGGGKGELFIDPDKQKLFLFFQDFSDDFTLAMLRCNLDATGCTRRNIGKLFGNNTNGAEPSATYDPINKRIYVATRNEELGNVISVYHFISYIED